MMSQVLLILAMNALIVALAEEYLRALEINCQQQLTVLRANPLFWVSGKPATPRIEQIIQMYVTQALTVTTPPMRVGS